MSINPFAAARQFVWDGINPKMADGQERFLCYALMAARDRAGVEAEDCYRARAMILSRLGEYKYLESWLCNAVGVSVNDTTQQNMQAYRLRWLNELEQLWNTGAHQ
ncbi:hypothetical protein SB861_37515 [Paraburkholderia sp. SIMBA_049]